MNRIFFRKIVICQEILEMTQEVIYDVKVMGEVSKEQDLRDSLEKRVNLQCLKSSFFRPSVP